MIITGNRSSSAAEDYLERIQELIDTKGYASVTNMVKRLDAEGFVRHEKYRGLILTTEGEAIARAIARRHRILTDFLRTMGVPESEVDHDVEGMEHHLSAASLTAIEVLLKELSENGTFLSRVRDAVGRVSA